MGYFSSKMKTVKLIPIYNSRKYTNLIHRIISVLLNFGKHILKNVICFSSNNNIKQIVRYDGSYYSVEKTKLLWCTYLYKRTIIKYKAHIYLIVKYKCVKFFVVLSNGTHISLHSKYI